MKLLEEKILKDAKVLPGGTLKVDSFLNQQIDIDLLMECAKEWHNIFEGEGVTKILTIESTGIGIACLAATQFRTPVVYAKKTRNPVTDPELISSRVVSCTHGTVYDIYCNKDFITASDRVLIIDDFLANGSALKALIRLIEKANATFVGAGIVIEKTYKDGANELRSMGYRIESLAKISSIGADGEITFC